MLQKRDIAICVILTVITCGIYGMYWLYCLTRDVNLVSSDHSIDPGTAVVLTIVTCGIYGIYWAYKMGQHMYTVKRTYGYAGDDRSALYLICSLFGFGIVVYILLQSDLNGMADGTAPRV